MSSTEVVAASLYIDCVGGGLGIDRGFDRGDGDGVDIVKLSLIMILDLGVARAKSMD